MDLRLPDTIQLSLLDKDHTADIAGVVDNSTYYRIILAHICHDADQSASCDDVHIYLDPILGAFVDRKVLNQLLVPLPITCAPVVL